MAAAACVHEATAHFKYTCVQCGRGDCVDCMNTASCNGCTQSGDYLCAPCFAQRQLAFPACRQCHYPVCHEHSTLVPEFGGVFCSNPSNDFYCLRPFLHSLEARYCKARDQ